MLDNTRHNLYSKIAEKISRNHEINWDGVSTEEADDLYMEAVSKIVFLEDFLDEYDGDLSLEEYQNVITEMMRCYIEISILERRQAIEELIEGI